ncbi:hypothetical protein PILCRDRAFT_275161 [Piloderma croceum F 1598]|uniref:Polymerase beta nucleotidyltransferase domain-containing protein n=1 Tax=Piloderma croceum (strain F 1598) TaxID=765440 RepID=A0A0C3FT53_PILCF|nr:hypothetical protein PILCRDRAFT_275161 [Piloderma croceum F 1598]
MHYPSDIRSMPTTALDIDLISSLCRPIFEEAHSLHPTISWAGIFGSVSRGAQWPDSDVDVLVGYSKHADFWCDVCGSINWLGDNLSDVLARKADVVTLQKLYGAMLRGLWPVGTLKRYFHLGCVNKWVAANRSPAYHCAVTDAYTIERMDVSRSRRTPLIYSRRCFDHY